MNNLIRPALPCLIFIRFVFVDEDKHYSSSSSIPENVALVEYEVPQDVSSLPTPCKHVAVPKSEYDASKFADLRQVCNILQGCLHLYCPSVHHERTVCGHWKCGAVDAAVCNAEFYSTFDTLALSPASFSHEFQPCGFCFSDRLLGKFGWDSVIPNKCTLLPSFDADSDAISSACSDSESSSSED